MSFGSFGERSEVRKQAYNALDSERVYQDRGLGNAKGNGMKSVGEHILCMEKLLDDARRAWYKPDGTKDAMDHFRKIGAVAVAGMERHGVQFRNID